MRENKEDICRQLFEAIRRTRAGDDVVGLRYVKEGYEEHVYVDFIDNPGGEKNQCLNGLRNSDDKGCPEQYRYRVGGAYAGLF